MIYVVDEVSDSVMSSHGVYHWPCDIGAVFKAFMALSHNSWPPFNILARCTEVWMSSKLLLVLQVKL